MRPLQAPWVVQYQTASPIWEPNVSRDSTVMSQEFLMNYWHYFDTACGLSIRKGTWLMIHCSSNCQRFLWTSRCETQQPTLVNHVESQMKWLCVKWCDRCRSTMFHTGRRTAVWLLCIPTAISWVISVLMMVSDWRWFLAGAWNGSVFICLLHYNNTTTVLRPFVRDYPGEPVPEETLTHSPSWSCPIFISFFHLPRSIASSLFKLRAWQSFCIASLHVLFGLPLGLEPSASYFMHFFTQSASSFRITCPYHRNPLAVWTI